MGGALRLVITLAALVISIVSLDRARDVLNNLSRPKKGVDPGDVYALPPPGYVKAAAIGYHDAVASVLWASTLYQYGEHVGHNQRFEYATQYLETIVTLDPSFRPAYRFASTLATMQAVAPLRVELDRVRTLLEQGTRELPHDADVWGAYASYMMFEGAQYLDEQEKMKWRVAGAHAAQRAVELGFFMDTLSISGASFLEKAGERDLAIAQLERAYAVAPSDDTRQRIAAKLRRLQAQESLARVERVHRFIIDRWRTEMPWTNESLFVVLGPQRDVPGCAGLSGDVVWCNPSWGVAAIAMAAPAP
jgi:tetratricopeptide (TPR) repeat protein